MAQGFLQSLDLKPNNVFSPEGLIVSYQKGNVDGSFVLHYLIADFIKCFGKRSRVLIVLSTETINHWSSVSSKLGWNFGGQEAKGHLKVIDLGQELFQVLTSEDAGDNASVSKDGGIDLERLYRNCRSQVEKMCRGNEDDADPPKVLIVVEDLTSVLFHVGTESCNSGSSERLVLNFLRKLLKLNNCVDGMSCEATVATLVNSCGSYFSCTLGKVLANVAFEVSPLTTGYSELFNGYLVVKQRMSSWTDKDVLVKSYQYKLDDRTIKFSPLTKFNF